MERELFKRFMVAGCPPLISHLACFLAGVMAAVHGMEPYQKPGENLKPTAAVVRQGTDGKRCLMADRLYQGRYRYRALVREPGEDLSKMANCEDESAIHYD